MRIALRGPRWSPVVEPRRHRGVRPTAPLPAHGSVVERGNTVRAHRTHMEERKRFRRSGVLWSGRPVLSPPGRERHCAAAAE